jgi:hypothetical protein
MHSCGADHGQMTSENFRGTFSEHIQGTFGEHSVNIFRELSGNTLSVRSQADMATCGPNHTRVGLVAEKQGSLLLLLLFITDIMFQVLRTKVLIEVPFLTGAKIPMFKRRGINEVSMCTVPLLVTSTSILGNPRWQVVLRVSPLRSCSQDGGS